MSETLIQADLAEAVKEIARLRAELEQAHVALEDSEERLAELNAANAALSDRLLNEQQKREAAELNAAQLLIQLESARAGQENPDLRQELSVTLEELKVMEEELLAAHHDLLRAHAI
jgi:chromosome segregation ATPase